MPALISIRDVEQRVGRQLSDVEQNRLTAVLDDVSAAIRSYTGQTISRATTTERLKITGLGLYLPQRPIVSVASVKTTAALTLPFEWYGGDRVSVEPLWTTSAPRTGQWIDVTYTHGYDPVPDDVIAVACQVAIRALAVPIDSTVIQQESIGGYSHSLGGAAANGALGLLLGERQILNTYRRRTRTLQL